MTSNMRYRICITKDGEDRPFWCSKPGTKETADRIRRKNQKLIDREGWKHTITLEEFADDPNHREPSRDADGEPGNVSE